MWVLPLSILQSGQAVAAEEAEHPPDSDNAVLHMCCSLEGGERALKSGQLHKGHTCHVEPVASMI
jgi:hypothetical protein